ncbi:MAG: bifunctional riboflavin kinase/FAD synthetase [Archangium gephyra]|uniref:Riboflavin biosynthesis protein n=1 Tax=Archangium gephyra TaxID=48 RepID=A0A2W5TFW2_9BACT|nr:MAG: bifunctional riboflavin kinase/FAD synthetase [Archangium gephyra]
MKVYSSLAEASNGALRGSAVCLGNFDGVHLGHQALFDEAAKHGPVVALTFQPHPGKVLQPQLAPRLIVGQQRKMELLEAAGATAVIVQPFSIEYARTPPADFESALLDGVGARTIVVGYDFTYGTKRAGTVATLEAAAAARGAQVKVVSAVSINGVVVSSSKIREYVLEGRVEAATALLGRPFDLDGMVVPGAGRGRTIGFPTANVDTLNELRPAAGVYAVRVRVEGEPRWHGGAANIGVKPTFGGGEVTIEAHLFDFAGDLYVKRLRVQFIERLRAEMRFASAAELSSQIARDLEKARAAVARCAP